MRALRSAAVVITATGFLAACSSSTPDPQESSTSAAPPAPTGHGAFSHCLAAHGVAAPPRPAGEAPPGVDPGTWHEAMQACSSLAPGPAN